LTRSYTLGTLLLLAAALAPPLALISPMVKQIRKRKLNAEGQNSATEKKATSPRGVSKRRGATRAISQDYAHHLITVRMTKESEPLLHSTVLKPTLARWWILFVASYIAWLQGAPSRCTLISLIGRISGPLWSSVVLYSPSPIV
jgi:hypothetical protein